MFKWGNQLMARNKKNINLVPISGDPRCIQILMDMPGCTANDSRSEMGMGLQTAASLTFWTKGKIFLAEKYFDVAREVKGPIQNQYW